jgi:rhodanese-related sulfurtransferase
MPKRISPHDAHELMQREDYVYVDVRSQPEYEASRPAGAVNLPLMHRGPVGLVPNPEFLRVFERALPPGTRLILGCQGGVRSARAAALLHEAGYDDLVECGPGFGGAKDAEGRIVEAGWCDSGLPCVSGPDAERGWDAMRSRAQDGA